MYPSEHLPTYAKIISPRAVTVHFQDGRSFHWPSTHPQFTAALTLLGTEASDWDVLELMDISAQLTKAVAGYGDVVVSRDGVFYKGVAVHMTITERILAFQAEGSDVGYLLKFLENLFKNPNRDSVLSVYDFLEANRVPITPDGCFLAYKKVKEDYTDYYSGKFYNGVGSNPKVEGWEVDPDRTQTCSKGLHVCSREYLPHYMGGNGRVVICKVNPAHVFAVPIDYNNAKMRVTEYLVVGELDDEQKADIFDNYRTMTPGQDIGGISWDEKLRRDALAVDDELKDYPDDDCPNGYPTDECCGETDDCPDLSEAEDDDDQYDEYGNRRW